MFKSEKTFSKLMLKGVTSNQKLKFIIHLWLQSLDKNEDSVYYESRTCQVSKDMFLDNIVNQNKSVKAKQGYTQDVTPFYSILQWIKAYIQLQYLISLRHHNSGEQVQSYH